MADAHAVGEAEAGSVVGFGVIDPIYASGNMGPFPRQRLLLTYEKGEAVKFISHQDEFRLWERTIRRADLPLLYKKGFNPQPHMHFAAPLGVGFTGAREFVDIVLSPPLPLDEISARIRDRLPPGVLLHAIDEVPILADSLAATLIGADYTLLIYAEPGELPGEELEARIVSLLDRSEIWRERERKGERYTYNLRPLVFILRYEGYSPLTEEHRIFLRVQVRPGATGRPDEVLDALELGDWARTLRRERLYFATNDEDAATFAAYPVIEQAQITGPKPPPVIKRGRDQGQQGGRPAGRTINERAGDEFD
ncbi:MAG: TIGR03936 family radical SAM-associated protein [Caldilineaceae bacterium]